MEILEKQEIEIGGKVYRFKITFGAIKATERRADKSVLRIIEAFAERDWRAEYVVAVLFSAIEAADPRQLPGIDAFGDMVVDGLLSELSHPAAVIAGEMSRRLMGPAPVKKKEHPENPTS